MNDMSHEPKVRIQMLDHAQGMPVYGSSGAAGADLFAAVEESAPMTIEPGGRALVPTGLIMEIPLGWEGQVRPRSGLAAKHGITCLNTPGTIDSDYRGEVKVILANFGPEPFAVTRGMRIAQMVFARHGVARFEISESLGETRRSSGGFGSTGV